MTAITLTYCALCDWTNKAFNTMIETCESIGKARAAHELTRSGTSIKKTKQLMTGRKDG